MLKRGKKKKEAEKKPTADTEQQEKVSEADNAETAANPGELISSLSETLEKNNKFSNRLFIVSFSFLVFLMLGYGFMTYQLSSKINLLDEGARSTALAIEEANKIIETLASAQTNFVDKQSELSSVVEKAGINVTDLQRDFPDAAAKRISIETDKVSSDVTNLAELVQQQSDDLSEITMVVNRLNDQLDDFQGELANTKDLNEDVAALVTLEREKYLAVLKRQADLQQKQKGPAAIQIPRDPNLIYYSIQSSAESSQMK
jgi:methyl-accepting chemotaxis protein